MMQLNNWFAHVAEMVAAGHALAFTVCCFVVLIWAVSRPVFGFSDTWQLVIHTGMTPHV